MQLWLERRASPIGTMLLVSDEAGNLRALDYHDYEPRLHKLLRLHYGAYTLDERAAPKPVTQALTAYFAGDLAALDAIPVATGGTDFQRALWAALRTLPAGQTTTYGDLARRLGRPAASRAVGAANGANPLSIVVPCHRVVGANGALTGYAGGLARKQWLLDHERKHALG